MASKRTMTTTVRARRTDLLRVLSDLKVDVTRATDDEIYGYCPRHFFNPKTNRVRKDNHPSWQMSRRSGKHLCWSCGYSGSLLSLVIDLVFPKEDKPIWKATSWLSGYGREINLADLEIEDRKVEPILPPRYMIEARFRSFRDPSDRALSARRITRGAAELYELKVDPDTNLWVLPVRGPAGDLWGWQFKTKGYFYNVPENMQKSKTLFGLKQFEGTRAVLVESQLDVVRMYSAGVDGGLASMGVRVTDIQMELIIERATELVVALDNPYIDSAGKAEAKRLERQYGSRIKMLFAGYQRDDPKDPGDMKPGDVRRLVETARMLGATKWRPPRTRLAVSTTVSKKRPTRHTSSQTRSGTSSRKSLFSPTATVAPSR